MKSLTNTVIAIHGKKAYDSLGVSGPDVRLSIEKPRQITSKRPAPWEVTYSPSSKCLKHRKPWVDIVTLEKSLSYLLQSLYMENKGVSNSRASTVPPEYSPKSCVVPKKIQLP
jgi:hypothetical protein